LVFAAQPPRPSPFRHLLLNRPGRDSVPGPPPYIYAGREDRCPMAIRGTAILTLPSGARKGPPMAGNLPPPASCGSPLIPDAGGLPGTCPGHARTALLRLPSPAGWIPARLIQVPRLAGRRGKAPGRISHCRHLGWQSRADHSKSARPSRSRVSPTTVRAVSVGRRSPSP
jgi:hypothetical protein